MPFIVKNTTKISIFDLLAPHSCRGCGRIGNAFCDRCKNNILANHQNFCPNCKNTNPYGKCQNCKNLPPTFVLGERDSLIGTLIKDYKYNSVRALANPLADMLGNIIKTHNRPITIVPLPTIDSHIRNRGLDHTLLLAKKLSYTHPNWTVEKALIRAKNSVQVGSDQKTRLSQAQSAYVINPKFKAQKNTTYLLIDDVWTTGASIKAGVKILNDNHVKDIIIGILAVSRLD